jgi:hypothetical protein
MISPNSVHLATTARLVIFRMLRHEAESYDGSNLLPLRCQTYDAYEVKLYLDNFFRPP